MVLSCNASRRRLASACAPSYSASARCWCADEIWTLSDVTTWKVSKPSRASPRAGCSRITSRGRERPTKGDSVSRFGIVFAVVSAEWQMILIWRRMRIKMCRILTRGTCSLIVLLEWRLWTLQEDGRWRRQEESRWEEKTLKWRHQSYRRSLIYPIYSLASSAWCVVRLEWLVSMDSLKQHSHKQNDYEDIFVHQHLISQVTYIFRRAKYFLVLFRLRLNHVNLWCRLRCI